MPEMSGFQTAEQVFKFYQSKNITEINIVACSAFREDEKYKEKNFVAYLEKPISKITFYNILEKYLWIYFSDSIFNYYTIF